MKKTICKYAKITAAIVMGVMLWQAQVAMAGWTGAMNGTGFGKASVNVLEFQGDKPTSVTTPNMSNPSVAMTTTTSYVYGGLLPKDASPATVAKVKGSPGYVWQATTIGSNGDSTDSTEFGGVQINPADCASLEMVTSASIADDKKSGSITVEATATAGTGLRVRGYEALGTLQEDNPLTEVDETLEFLKTYGSLKWDVTLLGPFTLNTNSCSAITIPFTVETTTDNLYFVTDGVAKSLPLVITCPQDIPVTDKKPVTYPETVEVGGCGIITVTFDPPAPAGGTFPLGFFPVGTTPVTVTATDGNTNTITCTFNVVVEDTTAPVITASGTPNDGVLGFNPTEAQINAALGTASATDNGTVGNPTPVDSSVTANGCSRSQTRTWTVTDAAGNAAAPVSRTATWTEDTTPPVSPSLPTVTGACGASVTLPAPTTTDNCGGSVTGTTTTVFPITTTGTTVVTWTFNDGNGNSSTATQNVIVTGLTFNGFYSPIGGTGGSCGSTLRTANLGNNLPVKFDVKCGGSPYLTGKPTLSIAKSNTQCNSLTPVGVVDFTLVGNEWHFNWDTGSGGVTRGTYRLTATLQDGSEQFVWIKLK